MESKDGGQRAAAVVPHPNNLVVSGSAVFEGRTTAREAYTGAASGERTRVFVRDSQWRVGSEGGEVCCRSAVVRQLRMVLATAVCALPDPRNADGDDRVQAFVHGEGARVLAVATASVVQLPGWQV